MKHRSVRYRCSKADRIRSDSTSGSIRRSLYRVTPFVNRMGKNVGTENKQQVYGPYLFFLMKVELGQFIKSALSEFRKFLIMYSLVLVGLVLVGKPEDMNKDLRKLAVC